MEFTITHVTAYAYTQPAAEAYGEARLSPPELPTQHIVQRALVIEPETRTSTYVDAWGNTVEFFSLPYRHTSLVVTNQLQVNTVVPYFPAEALDLSLQEARQLFASRLADIFDYLQHTPATGPTRESVQWARQHLKGRNTLRAGLESLNGAIYRHFKYSPGSTDNSTPLPAIWKQREGVCQDFAHIALSILRVAGLPARYVCGYIESEAPQPPAGQMPRRNLVGAIATHAWVEILLPGMRWIAMDPTNNCWCGEQHVAVSFGRDFNDASPLRGTFKGAGGQKLSVRVKVKRRGKSTAAPAQSVHPAGIS